MKNGVITNSSVLHEYSLKTAVLECSNNSLHASTNQQLMFLSPMTLETAACMFFPCIQPGGDHIRN